MTQDELEAMKEQRRTHRNELKALKNLVIWMLLERA